MANGKEIFAYVINRSKEGHHYWVNAHVTPSYDSSGNVVGYHSNRRPANDDVLNSSVIPLYKQIINIESQHVNKKEGLVQSMDFVGSVLKEKGISYDEFFFSLHQ